MKRFALILLVLDALSLACRFATLSPTPAAIPTKAAQPPAPPGSAAAGAPAGGRCPRGRAPVTNAYYQAVGSFVRSQKKF